MAHRMIGKLHAKIKDPKTRDEKVLSLFSTFRDRKADMVAYRRNLCNRKGPPRVNWIIGRLHAKNHRPKSKDKTVISF